MHLPSGESGQQLSAPESPPNGISCCAASGDSVLFGASRYDECNPFVGGVASETFTDLICRRLPRAADRLPMDDVMRKIIGAKGWLWRAMCDLALDKAVQSRHDRRGTKSLPRLILKA
jgi:hypothetical protein